MVKATMLVIEANKQVMYGYIRKNNFDRTLPIDKITLFKNCMDVSLIVG